MNKKGKNACVQQEHTFFGATRHCMSSRDNQMVVHISSQEAMLNLSLERDLLRGRDEVLHAVRLSLSFGRLSKQNVLTKAHLLAHFEGIRFKPSPPSCDAV
jgi:hypothetical protein